MRVTWVAIMMLAIMGYNVSEASSRPNYAGKILRKDYRIFEGQELSNGLGKVLPVNLQEKYQGVVKLEKVIVNSHKKLPPAYVLKRISCKKGMTLNLKELEKEILLFNNTNISQLEAELLPGESAETRILVLKVVPPENKYSAVIFVDNEGMKDTGKLRYGYHKDSYGLFHNEDRLISTRYWSSGVRSSTSVYDAPISREGTRAVFGMIREKAWAKKGVLKGDYKAYLNDMWAGISHPLFIDKNTKLEAFAELHRKWFNADYKGESDKRINAGSYGVKIKGMDRHGFTYAKIMGTMYLEENDDPAIAGVAKRGGYWYGEFMRKQEMGKERFLKIKLEGQYTNERSLPFTESLFLGGDDSIRGFDESILDGDKGIFGTLEYSFPLNKKGLKGQVFYDYGLVYDKAESNRQSLTSCGVGIGYSQKGWSGNITLGVPLAYSEEIKASDYRLHFSLLKNI